MAELRFHPDDPRIRRLNDRPVVPGGEFVLYWMQVFRRADDNAALAWAVERANDLGLPCLVYEALGPDYPHASDRIHRFVLEGARGTSKRFAARGIAHVFFLPKTREAARHVVARIAQRAAMIVSDDFPSFVVPGHHAAAAARAPCAYVAIDDCAVVPMALLAKEETAARTIRPKVMSALATWLRPIHDPSPRIAPPKRLDLPFESVDFARASLDELVAACAIDHDVAPAVHCLGGSLEAERRLRAFVRGPLETYDAEHNDPSRALGPRRASSGLSPYLHFGMVSARRVALEALSWASGRGLDVFLDELLVRRSLSFNFARSRADHAQWSALPAWARATLKAHRRDPRDADVSVEELEHARSPDPLWNAAMRELRATGVIQPYARMLWGKLPITWMSDPETAHAAMVHLNDKWALDGRDPNGYANVSWCFGLHDRPWPENAHFGHVRKMTTASARRKLDFEEYIAHWSR